MKLKLRFLLLLFIWSAVSCFAFSDGSEYAINKIPANLSQDADAVIRRHSITFEVKDESSAILKETIVVTIFNKEGQHYGKKILHYNKFSEIENIEGRILDDNGEEIRALKSKDINDYSSYNDYTLYADSRVKVAELYYDRFPYTVEYEYEISYDGYLGWPDWYSRHSLDPVEFSDFEVLLPKNYKLRYWCNKDSVKPIISNDGRSYTWKASKLERLSYDAVGEDIEDVAAIVYIAPSDFEIDGYKGSMRTWKDFGLWYKNLFKDRDILPEKIVNEVKALISSGDDTKQKITKLYKYMQSRTRYVSIDLGIGGWQPFDASFVHEHGYGDCKALSNYMVALLKTVGINSFTVLINNGDHRLPLITEFPSHQFNHAVTCVPLDKDTVWLECTNPDALAGNIGHGNENRNALMITPDGGIIVYSPISKSNQNSQINKMNVTLSITGGEADGMIKWTGNQDNTTRMYNKVSSPLDQEKWIVKFFDVPEIKLNKFSFSFSDSPDEPSSLNLKVNLPRYTTFSNNRLFFYPNLMNRRTSIPKDVTNRLSPVRFSYPYLDVDSISYSIPAEYIIEALPKEVNLTSSFGVFTSKVIKTGENQLLFIRSLEIKNYSIPAKQYSEYRKFFADIVKADRAQVVLAKR